MITRVTQLKFQLNKIFIILWSGTSTILSTDEIVNNLVKMIETAFEIKIK